MNDAIEDLFDKGLDHFNVDSYDEAVKIFSEVLKMDPDHPDGWYYRGLAHANKGSFDMAIDDFTKAVEKIRMISTVILEEGRPGRVRVNLNGRWKISDRPSKYSPTTLISKTL